MASNTTTYDPILNGSEATPGLWNRRFEQTEKNIASVNSIVPDTSASVTSWAGRVYVDGNLKTAGKLSTTSLLEFTQAGGATSNISVDGALVVKAHQGVLKLDSSTRIDLAYASAQHMSVGGDGVFVNSGVTFTSGNKFQVGNSGVTTASGATLILGGKLVLPQQNNATNPTLAFGDGNTGFYERIDNELGLVLEGARKWIFSGNNILANEATGPGTRNTGATSTNPSFNPNRADADTGLGWAATDQLSLIAGGVESLRASPNTVRFISVRSDVADVTGLASGNTGDFSISTSHLHICVSANSWRRIALVAF